jgi:hypothetical protein
MCLSWRPDPSCTSLGVDVTADFASGSIPSLADRLLIVDVALLLPLVDEVTLAVAVVPDDETHQDEQNDDAAKNVVEDGLALAGLGSVYTDEWYRKARRLQARSGRQGNRC